MIYQYMIEGGRLSPVPENNLEKTQILLCSVKEIDQAGGFAKTSGSFLREMAENPDIRFESHAEFDFMCVPAFEVRTSHPFEYPVYFIFDGKQMIMMVQEPGKVDSLLRSLEHKEQEISPEYIVFLFLEKLIQREEDRVEVLERELDEKEEFSQGEVDSEEYIKQIVHFRKRLLQFKHFYEHLRRVIEGIEENENVLYSDMILKRFAILEERSRSMIEDIQVLREEVIQLKEGYQAQRDLKMNRTMQFLTVVTTIFMPLTLLAGWYGMNFNMPEYDSPFGYPILIIISILLIKAGILICKKKKWL